MFIAALTLTLAMAVSTEHGLIAIKAEAMTADYHGDLSALASLRGRAAELSNDPDFGYLADYWSGFASWRIVVNGAGPKMPREEAIAHLREAATDFEKSISKRADFADGYAGAAAVHGWLAAYNHADQKVMNEEVATFQRFLKRATELEPNNPRVLWIQAVPYAVLPPERGGSIDRAIELYKKMLENATPLNPQSPLPDWGKAEALMSLAYSHMTKSSAELKTANENAAEALRLQPDWHYVKDVLIPQLQAKGK